MQNIFAILVGAAGLGVLIWLLIPSSSSQSQPSDDELLDPSDTRHIDFLIGFFGGGIADAALARFALERFEQIHGRKATTRDISMVLGLMSGGDSLTGGGDNDA